MTRQELLDAVPGFVDAHWPKNDAAAAGGEATPGRGEACVAITRFILQVTPADDRAALSPGDQADRIRDLGNRLDYEDECLKAIERSWRHDNPVCAQLALLDAIAFAVLAIGEPAIRPVLE